MTTIREVEKYEHRLISASKKIIKNNSEITYLTLTLIILGCIVSLWCILLLATTGGNLIVIKIGEQVSDGQLTGEQYNLLITFIYYIADLMNIAVIITHIVLAGIIIAWFYVGFKAYMRYKRDNL